MFDTLIRGGDVVFPGKSVRRVDVGIDNGVVSAIGDNLGDAARTVVDARGKTVFPGVVDSHFHLGIFRPLSEDAVTESSSAVAGGVTSILIYHRGGRNNLLTDTAVALPAPYAELFPRVRAESEGNFHCDYGYNVAPVSNGHLEEIPGLVADQGVSTFKFYMHYRGIDPAAYAPGPGEKEYVFTDGGYDLGYLHQIMMKIADVRRTVPQIRLSIHAEDPGIIRENTQVTKSRLAEFDEGPLALYSRTRPPSGERLGILQSAELARQTECAINILHISSGLALETVKEVRRRVPSLDLLAEATVHHLLLTTDLCTTPEAKVNPPIRTDDDRDALWKGIVEGDIQTVVSDHAAIAKERKAGGIWDAWYGFGGTELLLPSLITEGHLKRGVPLERLAELLSLAPARYHGLAGEKGDIAVGLDADLALVDLERSEVVDHAKLHSAQDFSPFDGMRLSGWPETTILRGEVVYAKGLPGPVPRGRYLHRPA